MFMLLLITFHLLPHDCIVWPYLALLCSAARILLFHAYYTVWFDHTIRFANRAAAGAAEKCFVFIR